MRRRRILMVTGKPGRVASLLRSRAVTLDVRSPADAERALSAPVARYLGVVWDLGGGAPSRQAARLAKMRHDLPFLALVPAGSGARPAADGRGGAFRARVAMPTDASHLAEIVVREARLLEAEAELAEARATARMQARRLSILSHISRAANSVLEPRKVMEIVMSRAQDLIRTEAWSLLLVDEKEHSLSFEMTTGERIEQMRNYRVKIGQGVAGWVVQYKKPLIINDVKEDRRYDARIDMLTGFRTRSILCVPLISRGRIIGAVELINK